MTTLQIPTETSVSCPICNSEAIYKYGRTRTGKQRFQCLMCGRQFSYGAKKQEIQGKPICPVCGNPMHLYKIEGEVIRFRCSDYPVCKTFRKFRIKEED
jgi:transposase-like protein